MTKATVFHVCQDRFVNPEFQEQGPTVLVYSRFIPRTFHTRCCPFPSQGQRAVPHHPPRGGRLRIPPTRQHRLQVIQALRRLYLRYQHSKKKLRKRQSRQDCRREAQIRANPEPASSGGGRVEGDERQKDANHLE